MSIGAINDTMSSANIYAGREQRQPGNIGERAAAETAGLQADRTDGSLQNDPRETIAAPRDEYIHGDGSSEKSPGIYSIAMDEDGNQKIVFDRPEAAAEDAAQETAPPAEKKAGPAKKEEEQGGEWCRMNTDRVEAEIKKLKEKISQLEQQLQRAANDTCADERRKLELQLSQAKAELSNKDTDAYRKANAIVTSGEEQPAQA